MTAPGADILRWIALLFTAAVVTVGFLYMVWPFLIPLLLAAISAQMAMPLQRRIKTGLHLCKRLAAFLTLLLLSPCLIAPLMGLIFISTEQAVAIHEATAPTIAGLKRLTLDGSLPDWVPL